MVQRPMDLDTACALALLQEEVAEGEIGSPPRTPEHKYIRLPSRAYSQFHHSNTTPTVNRSMDNRGQETAKMPSDERLTALRNLRRAKGLCFKCGERWGHQHTCPTIVQMHTVEELLALFSEEDITGGYSADPVAEEQEVMCSISIHALRGVSSETSGVIQLHAFIADMEMLILVDSGSSASFINKMLADKLAGAQKLQKPCTVRVADGSQHRCTTYIPVCQWTSQGCHFTTDLKILPLGSFDAILGMDWLEQHNPTIDWIQKTLQLQTAQGMLLLQGHTTAPYQCSIISTSELNAMCKQQAVANPIHVHALDGQVQIEEITPTELQPLLS
uniref:Uncharacterized protein n=1 Tax=Avena sativa TaxID=4498 RepID=A0ACD5V7W1_AVESA